MTSGCWIREKNLVLIKKIKVWALNYVECHRNANWWELIFNWRISIKLIRLYLIYRWMKSICGAQLPKQSQSHGAICDFAAHQYNLIIEIYKSIWTYMNIELYQKYTPNTKILAIRWRNRYEWVMILTCWSRMSLKFEWIFHF